MLTEEELQQLCTAPYTHVALCSTQESRARIPFVWAAQNRVLPLAYAELERGKTLVGITDAPSRSVLEQFRFLAQSPVDLLPTNHPQFSKALFCAYHRHDHTLELLAEKLSRSEPAVRAAAVALPQTDTNEFLMRLLEYAVACGASDIHITPRPCGASVVLRKHGSLLARSLPQLSVSAFQEVIGRLKVLCGSDPTAKATVFDGSCKLPIDLLVIEVRVSIVPTMHGERAVIRLFGLREVGTLGQVGFSENILTALRTFAQRDEGIILFAGSTGSGKTSSLYALAYELAQQGLAVSSIEDPVEALIDGVAQSSVKGTSYEVLLKALLRQDPDVLIVGELRAADAAAVLFQAAQTGHLCASSVHAGSTEGVLLRLLDLQVSETQLRCTPLLIIHQRLEPQACPTCSVYDHRGTVAQQDWQGGSIRRSTGCSACEYTGIVGRALVATAIVVDSEGEKRLSLCPQVRYNEVG